MITDPNRVKEIFLQAAEQQDEATRGAYLDRACASDAGLRDRVEALLRSHDPAGSFLGTPAVALAEPNGATQELGDAAPQTPKDQTVSLNGEGDDAMSDNKKTAPSASDDDDLQFLSPSTRPDSLGRLGHYEMLQVLGRGGFGIVFRAFDEMLQRVVAIKVMAPQIATLSPARKRFVREAQSSAKVRHENVVQVYEVGEQPLPYLAMEFIPGETLQQKLDRNGPLEVSEVLRIGRQIAEGLAAAHACDLIHRDIKPGNVLLEGGSNKAKITDFGLARAADDASISQSGIIAGTPMFMAPEQALGHHIDQRADLFSLGSVLYQMASGRPPFRAPSALAVLKRVAEEPPRPITEIIPETPDWLCGIIAKLHAKNPEDRFQSAREVADLLADCEAKLKAKQEVKNVLPAVKPAAPTASAGWKWAAAAAVVMLPMIALAATEFAGVTHLFRGQQSTPGPDLTPPIQVPKLDTPPLAVAPFDAAKAKQHQEAWAKHLGVEVEVTNSIGMKLRVIPPGQFLMGSPDDEVGRQAHEGPQHEVVITQPFGMGVHDVTVGQFKEFVKAKGYQTKAEKDGGAWRPFLDSFWKQDPQVNWQSPGFEQTDEHPVVCVSWFDAKAFCDWLSEREGKKYTLPTEAQWEYACRAGSNTKFSFGDDDQELGQHGWYRANSKGKPNLVGQRKPNSWGLNDVESNVAQWTADWFAADFYQKSPKEDPIGPTVGTVGTRVLRGGNWWDGPNSCRAAFRGGAGFWDPWKSSINIGFRVVQVGDLKSKTAPIDLTTKNLPPTFKNSIGMEFVIVPKGKSWLGGGKGKLGDKEVEIPADFYLGKYEVTQEEWTQVMGENPSWFSRTGEHKDSVKDIPDADLKRFPVETVSWDDCQLFVAKLNKLEKETGWVYRLPKEAEWEYACRGGPMADHADSAFDFYFAKPTNNLLPDQANFGEELKRACKVGSYEANRLGLFDLHGNVWEWCDELFDPNNQAAGRVVRGGSCIDAGPHCRAAHLSGLAQTHRGANVGFRLARVPSGAVSPEAKTPPVAVAAGWTLLKPIEMKSEGGANLAVQKDLSILVSGNHPDRDVYTLTFRDLPSKIHALHLEALPHDTLPGKGSGRNPDPNCTFVLTTIKAELDQPKGAPLTLKFGKAWSDHDVPESNATHAIDADDNTGWTTEKGKAVYATFELDQIVAVPAGAALRVTLEFKHDAPKRQLGCFRLSVSKDVIDVRTGEFDNWLGRVAALPAAEQVEEVRKELIRRNPGFDGTLEHKIEEPVVTEFRIVTDQVTDIAPIRVFNALRVLGCGGTYAKGQLADLTPLKGMNLAGLTRLDLTDTKVTDAEMVYFQECKNLTALTLLRTQVGDAGLVHFQDCKDLTVLRLDATKVSDAGLAHLKGSKALTQVYLGYTKVSDSGLANFKDCKNLTNLFLDHLKVGDAGLSHFKDCKNLTTVGIHNTRVSDAGLAYLKGMPRRFLYMYNTPITDLTPLQGMPLEKITLTPKNITRGLDILRDMKSLKTIGIGYNQSWPAAEFWERYDKGEFKN